MESSGFELVLENRRAFFHDSLGMSLSTMYTPCHKNIMITLVLSSKKIHIDLQDTDPVKATSVLCLLGFGLGLGSLLVYKLYNRLFNSASHRRRSSSADKSNSDADQHQCLLCGRLIGKNSSVESNSETVGFKMGSYQSTQRQVTTLPPRQAKCQKKMGNSYSDDASYASAYFYGDGVRLRGIREESGSTFYSEPQRKLTDSQRTESFEVIDTPPCDRSRRSKDSSNNAQRPQSLSSSSPTLQHQDGLDLDYYSPMREAISPTFSDTCGSFSDISIRPSYSPDSLNERNSFILHEENMFPSNRQEVSDSQSDIKYPPVPVIDISQSEAINQCEGAAALPEHGGGKHVIADRAPQVVDDLSSQSTPERVMSPQIRRLRERWSISSEESSLFDTTSRRQHSSMSPDLESSPEHCSVCRTSSALSKLSSFSSDLDYSSGLESNVESDVFDLCETTFDYDKILREIKDVYSELDDMSCQVGDLCSTDNGESTERHPPNRRRNSRYRKEMKQVYKILRRHKSQHKALPRSVSLHDEHDFSSVDKHHCLKRFLSLSDKTYALHHGNVGFSSTEDSRDDDSSLCSQDHALDAVKLASKLKDPDELSSKFRHYLERIRSDLGESFDSYSPNRTTPSSSNESSRKNSPARGTTFSPSLPRVPGSFDHDHDLTNANVDTHSTGVFPHRLKKQSSSDKSEHLLKKSSSHQPLSFRKDSIETDSCDDTASTDTYHAESSDVLTPFSRTRSFNIDLKDSTDSDFDMMSVSYRSQDSGLDTRDDFLTPESPLTSSTTELESTSLDLNIDLHKEERHSLSETLTHPATASKHQSAKVENQNSENADSSTNAQNVNVNANIRPAEDILRYVEREWKGSTPKAVTIRKGYMDIPQRMNCQRLRNIRGDNYCALRATIYQCFVNNLHSKSQGLFPHKQEALQCLDKIESGPHAFLHQWNFANRLPFSSDSVLSTAKDCLACFYGQRLLTARLPDYASREKLITHEWNNKPLVDVKIMEAVKLLMMMTAVHYYQRNQEGQEVPMFVWLMFARDTSETPAQLVRNHLNQLGDSGGVEQIEMLLLAYTLGVCITVARPSQQGHEDFITQFPSDVNHFPSLYLIAEDDRHYNVAVP